MTKSMIFDLYVAVFKFPISKIGNFYPWKGIGELVDQDSYSDENGSLPMTWLALTYL